MATVVSPYGLVPIKKLGGQVYNGSTTHYPIASGQTTSIFTGDLVKLGSSGGTIQKDTGTTSATPIGVFVGCEYTDPNLKYKVYRPYWPTATVASDAKAFVVDDPDVIFKIQSDGSATLTATSIGVNASIVQGSGSTTTGLSGVSFTASTIASTSTFPLKIVGIDPGIGGTSAWGDAYVDVWVIINITTHQWRTALANSP